MAFRSFRVGGTIIKISAGMVTFLAWVFIAPCDHHGMMKKARQTTARGRKWKRSWDICGVVELIVKMTLTCNDILLWSLSVVRISMDSNAFVLE